MKKTLKPTLKLPLNLVRTFFMMTPLSVILLLVIFGNKTQNIMYLCSFWLIVYLVLFYIIQGSLKNTTYFIEDNKIMRQTHFWGRRYKEVLLCNVTEVELRVGVLQNLFGLGKVVIHTQTILAGNRPSGIVFHDIEEVDVLYKTLNDAVLKQQTR